MSANVQLFYCMNEAEGDDVSCGPVSCGAGAGVVWVCRRHGPMALAHEAE
jgi:hypothetical protein